MILGLALGLILAANPVGATQLKDVPADHWARDAVKELVDRGIMAVYEDGSYRGEEKLDRYTLAVILARLLDQVTASETGIPQDDLEMLKEVSNELSKELVAWHSAKEKLLARMDQCEELTTNSDIKLSLLIDRMLGSETDISDLEQKLLKAMKQIEDLAAKTQSQITSLESECNRIPLLARQVDELSTKRKAEVDTALQKLATDLEHLSTDLDKERNRVNSNSENLAATQTYIQDLKREINNIVSTTGTLVSETRDLTQATGGLEKATAELDAARTSMDKRIHALQSNVDLVTGELTIALDSVDELQRKYESLEEKLKIQAGSLASNRKGLDNVQARLKQQTEDIESLRSDVTGQDNDLTAITANLASVKENLTTLTEDFEALRHSVSVISVKADVSDVQRAEEALAKKIAQQANAIQSMTNRLQQLEDCLQQRPALSWVDGKLQAVNEDLQALDDRITAANSDLQKLSSDVRTELDDLRLEDKQTEKKLSTLQNSLAGLDRKLEDMSVSLNQLETGLTDTSAVVEKNSLDIHGLKTQLATLSSAKNDLQTQVSDQKELLNGISERIASIDLDKLQASVGQIESELAATTATATDNSGQIAQINKQLQDLADARDTLQTLTSDHQAVLDGISDRLAGIDLDKLRASVAQINTDLAATTATATDNSARITRIDQQVQDIDQQVQDLVRTRDALQALTSDQKAVLNTISDRLSGVNLDQLEKSVAQIESGLAATNVTADDNSARITQINRQLQDLADARDTLQTLTSEQQAVLDGISDRLADIDLDKLQVAVTQINTDLATITATATDNSDRIAQINQKLQDLARTKADLNALESARQDLQTQFSAQKSMLEKLTPRIQDLESGLDRIDSDMASRQELAAREKQWKEDLKQRADELSQFRNAIEQEYSNLADRLKDLESRLATLEERNQNLTGSIQEQLDEISNRVSSQNVALSNLGYDLDNLTSTRRQFDSYRTYSEEQLQSLQKSKVWLWTAVGLALVLALIK